MRKNLISFDDVTKEEMQEILDITQYIKDKQKRGELYEPLKKKTLGLIFQKPSTRTRVSFDAGMFQLGGKAIILNLADLQLSRGESIEDTARVLSRYMDGMVIRGEHRFLAGLAKNSTIPVINGLTEKFHPCQILSDLFTIKERGMEPKGLKVVFVGDGNNVCLSLMQGAAKFGMNMVFTGPEGYEPDGKILKQTVAEAKKNGGSIKIEYDPEKAVREADVIYTDTWVSMGQEKEEAARVKAFRLFQVNAKLLKKAKQDCMIMHCLPAHRGQEITSEVLDGKQSVVWDQAENRLHTQKAVLMLWLSK